MSAKQLTVTQVFTFHTDPGHGWLEVTIRDLEAVGLSRRDFSRFSYVAPGSARCFLEEDCDAPKFMRAMDAAGMSYRLTEKHTDGEHPIRNMFPIW